VFRKVRSSQRAKEIAELKSSRSMRQEHASTASTQSPEHRAHESMMRTPQNFPAATPAVEFEPPTYGAYRIDQEVGKLVLGKPHRMDVMASRVPEDRRAIEASLIKALASYDTGEEGRRRVREALEEYGFVARQSALMLMGRDAWERSSAARTLGEIG